MAVMTWQEPLAVAPAGAVEIGQVAALVEEADGSGRTYVRGELSFVWPKGDQTGRRLAAVQLVTIQAATAADVTVGFGIGRETLRRWMRAAEAQGTVALIPGRRGPKGPSKMTEEVAADIRARRAGGATLRQIAAQVGLSVRSVRRALAEVDQPDRSDPGWPEHVEPEDQESGGLEQGGQEPAEQEQQQQTGAEPEVLGRPVPRARERVAARWHLIGQAKPVFTPAAQVPLAGMLTALPALEATGLIDCAQEIYGQLAPGFYGLSTMLLEGVFRALAGQPRAEGAGRFDPVDLGRVLGMDRAPEVKTIRRKIAQLAARERAGDLLSAMAAAHLGAGQDEEADALVLYVDGHVRTYQGTKKVAKTHTARLRFPAPATVETWVSDAGGDPVLVVMAEPGASLAGELRRLLPELRAAVGDERRVLVGFDRGGWSPGLFAHMAAAGFDVLTWRKGPTEDVDAEEFSTHTFIDHTGREHTWHLAQTLARLPLTDGGTFPMRQITRQVTRKGQTKQIHVLTTRAALPPEHVLYRMGSRWRQENYFRYARTHLALDSHDSYGAGDDDPERKVPNPAKKAAHQVLQNTTAKTAREKTRAQGALLAARSTNGVITNDLHNQLTADWHRAEDDLAAAQADHAAIPARVPLGELAPDQQVLEVETKLVHHAIRIAAFNTTTALARAIRIHTTYARAAQEAYTLVRQVLTGSGDIIPDETAATLTIRLDPMPTARQTAAVAELCQHLTATDTIYPGTNLRLRYQIKTSL